MTPHSINIVGSQDSIQEINAEINSHDNCKSRVLQKRNLDGSTSTWVAFGTVAISALPHILNFMNRKKVRKIKINDIEVENPTDDMNEVLIELIKKRISESEHNTDLEQNEK